MRQGLVTGVIGALVAVAGCGGEENRASRFPVAQATDPVDDEVDYSPRADPEPDSGDSGNGGGGTGGADSGGNGGGGEGGAAGPQEGNARSLLYEDETSWW